MEEKISKSEELNQWKKTLIQMIPTVNEQIEWLTKGDVVPKIKDDCPKELIELAKHLVEIQLQNGEYQREKISTKDIEKIKYFSKKFKIGFEDVVNLAVENNRYLSKDRLEARGIAIFSTEVQSVLERYYSSNRFFPINAMSAESKRSCRKFKNDITLTEKIAAILEIYFPEFKGVDIVEKNYTVVPQSKYQLTKEDVAKAQKFFNKNAIDGLIDSCFDLKNEKEFIEISRLISKANMTLDEFLKQYTNLSYTKCYSSQILPAVKQMISNYQERYNTTRNISTVDKYLRGKIESAQNLSGYHTMCDLVQHLGIDGDNEESQEKVLMLKELSDRHDALISALSEKYPDGIIEENFISKYPKLYEELKLLSLRYANTNMNEYLAKYGFTRTRSHNNFTENLIYLSYYDLIYYGFNSADMKLIKQCELKELNPTDYFGVYNNLIYKKQDCRANKKFVYIPKGQNKD